MSEPNNVVALPGYTIPTPRGEPCEAIVDALEQALGQAKAGAIVGLGLALVIDDGSDLAQTHAQVFWVAPHFRTTFFAVKMLDRHVEQCSG